VTLELGAALLEACGLSVDVDEARTKLMQTLDSGAAADRFARMVDALGGPADLTERPEAHLAVAPIVVEVRSATVGRITQVDVRALGLAVVRLGGGRIDPGAPIDHAVGLVDFAELGQRVAFDDVIARVHARSASDADAARQAVIDAFTVAPD
jgi:thymidine phosphorylase